MFDSAIARDLKKLNNFTMYITDESDLEILREVILSKNYFRNKGEGVAGHCHNFEKNFASLMGSKYSLLVTSGTNALICALSSLELQAEDEVIMPSFTYFATAVAVVKSGGTPVIVNVDESLMIDPIEVEAAITPKTKAIIAVHMDGHPCDMRSLKNLASKYNLFLIEDNAQACGGSFQGQRLGSIGDIGCFSFNVDKMISCGEGGAVITNNRKFYERSLCIQDACCSFGPTFKNSFTEIDPFIGQSMRVSEISGALMGNQLLRLDFILKKLRAHQSLMETNFHDHQIMTIPSNDKNGDCGSSIYIKFDDAQLMKKSFLNLLNQQIVTFPISNRPAHTCWQWLHLLNKERKDLKILKSQYLKSIDLLSSVLKINVPFDLTLDQVFEYSEKVSGIIRNE